MNQSRLRTKLEKGLSAHMTKNSLSPRKVAKQIQDLTGAKINHLTIRSIVKGEGNPTLDKTDQILDYLFTNGINILK